MPNMANIVVKKADGVTDVTWTVLTPSAGDNSPARWRSNSVSTVLAQRPTLEVRTLSNARGTGRRVRVVGSWPLARTENGVDTIYGSIPMEYTVLVPQDLDATVAAEAAAQFANLVASSLLTSVVTDGYAPT